MVEPIGVHPFYAEAVAAANWRRRLVLRLLPLHVYVSLRTEWHFAALRLHTRHMADQFKGARNLLLNLGPGSRGLPGWINVDGWPASNVNCVYDCRKRLPFPDGSARGIFTEHFVEHLDYTEEIPSFLSECHRVLEPGGVIRIIVPDAEKYLRAYCETGWDAISRVRSRPSDRIDPWLEGRYHTKMELINALFRQGHEHKYAYDYETMAFVLGLYGFGDIARQTFGQSRSAELALDFPERATESLYVEAVKPYARPVPPINARLA